MSDYNQIVELVAFGEGEDYNLKVKVTNLEEFVTTINETIYKDGERLTDNQIPFADADGYLEGSANLTFEESTLFARGNAEIGDRTPLAEYDDGSLPSGWDGGTQFIYNAGNYDSTGTGGVGFVTTDISIVSGKEYIVLLAMNRPGAGTMQTALNGVATPSQDNTGWASGFRTTRFVAADTGFLQVRCNFAFNDGTNAFSGLKVYQIEDEGVLQADRLYLGGWAPGDFANLPEAETGILLEQNTDIITAGTARWAHYPEYDFIDTIGNGDVVLQASPSNVQLGSGQFDIRVYANTDITFNYGSDDVDFTIKKNASGDAYLYDAGLDTHTFDSVTNITDTTASTSTTTGALTVAGGAGISGSLFINNNFDLTGLGFLHSDVALDNDTYLKGEDTGGTSRRLIGANNTNGITIGSFNGMALSEIKLQLDQGFNEIIFNTTSSTFNSGRQDRDFIINAISAGVRAYKYDAGLATHTFSGAATLNSALQVNSSITTTGLVDVGTTLTSNGNFTAKASAFFEGDATFDNDKYIKGETAAGTERRLLGVNGSDVLVIGPFGGGDVSQIYMQLGTSQNEIQYNTTGTIFNVAYDDRDFTLRKNTSGDAYKYDAGLDVHTWGEATPDGAKDFYFYRSSGIVDTYFESGNNSRVALYLENSINTWSVRNQSDGNFSIYNDTQRVLLFDDDLARPLITGSNSYLDLFGDVRVIGDSSTGNYGTFDVLPGASTAGAYARFQDSTGSNGFVIGFEDNDSNTYLNSSYQGDTFWDHNNITFNSGASDSDFTIKKNTSGTAYVYDAGLDTHTFNGDVYFDADINATTFRYLDAETGGLDNFFIGPTTNTANSGINNVALGHNAGRVISSGSNNFVMGSSAGNVLSTGSSNLLLGTLAGAGISTGVGNIVLGVQAYSGANATGNTVIGYQAGQGASGSTNVCIGYKTGGNATGGELYISNSNTATPLIYGNFATPELKIHGNFIANGANADYDFTINKNTSGTAFVYDAGTDVITLGSNLTLAAGTTSACSVKFQTGSLLTTPDSGCMEFDGARYYLTESGDERRVISLSSDAKVADTTVVNTTTETTLYTVDVQPESTAAGKVYRIPIFGKFSTGSAAHSVTLRFKIDGTTLTTAFTGRVVTDEPWHANFYFIIRTTGATGTFASHVHLDAGNQSFDITPTTGTIDTTITTTLSITAEWSNASASNSVTAMGALLEDMN